MVIIMIEKRYTKHRFLTIILIIAITFFIGVLLGKHMNTSDQEDVTRYIKHLELNTESFLVEQELLGATQDCTLAKERINSLSSELYGLGIMLGAENAESNLGKDNYFLLKKKFHLMQIRTYLLHHALKENCETEDHIALFYYGRENANSEEQGKILDEIVKKYPINVFAIEFNYTPELTFLEGNYNITAPPAVVLDYENIIYGLATYEEIVDSIV